MNNSSTAGDSSVRAKTCVCLVAMSRSSLVSTASHLRAKQSRIETEIWIASSPSAPRNDEARSCFQACDALPSPLRGPRGAKLALEVGGGGDLTPTVVGFAL